MKKIIIGIGVTVIIGLFSFAYWFTSPKRVTQTTTTGNSAGQNVGLPVSPSVTQNTTSATSTTMMSIAGYGGQYIQTINFINDPATVKDTINAGYYYLGYHTPEGTQDATATNDPPYVITYLSDTQYFNIALLQEPIGPVREEMQMYLMTHLGITQSQMCLLNYMVSVPDSVNSQYSSRNLGLSFCPGATILPK